MQTLQTVALILSHPPEGIPKYPIPPRIRNIRGQNTAPRCTLILSPLSVMANWKLEINKHVNQRVKNKNLSVAIYHGKYLTSWNFQAALGMPFSRRDVAHKQLILLG